MNIRICPLQNANGEIWIVCPGCHSSDWNKHGSYFRKAFNAQGKHVVTIPVKVQRYRCLNPDCPWCTFSVLPPLVVRYCRFFWPCLLAIRDALASGSTRFRLARHVWHVGWGVIQRAAALLNQLLPWVTDLHQELTDGKPVRELALMVKVITAKLGRLELSHRWYRRRYPLRLG
jgi:hypothetical protein